MSAPTMALAPRVYSDQRHRRRHNHWRIGFHRRGLDRRRQGLRWLFDRGQKLPADGCDLPARGLSDNECLAEDVEIGCTRSNALGHLRPVSAAGNQEGDVVSEIRERKTPARRSGQNLENGDLKTHANAQRHARNLRRVIQPSPWLCK
jgi:hypothetical protein